MTDADLYLSRAKQFEDEAAKVAALGDVPIGVTNTLLKQSQTNALIAVASQVIETARKLTHDADHRS